MWSGDAGFRLTGGQCRAWLRTGRMSVAVDPTANVEWSHSTIASLIEQWQKHPCLFTDARARLELSWPYAIRP